MKRFMIAAALSAPLLFSQATMAFADGEWWRDGFNYVYYHDPKIMVLDQPDGVFHPNREVSRVEVADALWRFDGMPDVAGQRFWDVQDSDAVDYVSGSGIMNGIDSRHFDPDSPITREQMAAIAYRFAQAAGLDARVPARVELAFPDYGDISDYAYGAVAWAVGEGLMTGTDQGFEPKATLTRGQIATIIMRLSKVLNLKSTERTVPDERNKAQISENKQAFVDNLGWLLRQTETGVIETELSLSGGKEFVRVNFQDQSLKVDVTGLSYAEIVLAVMEEIV